jgi:putative hydrolase of the HAD superfamily
VVILFDLYNTLVPSRDTNREAVTRAMGADLGVDPDAYQRLFLTLWRERLTGAFGDLHSTVRTLARRLGAEPSEAAVNLAVSRRAELTRSLIQPSAQTLHVLDELRGRGHRLGLVSNCTVETTAVWPDTPLAARFDTAIFSCLLGVGKPGRGSYLAACAALGAEPGNCVFVGDGADQELPGAAAVGLRAIQTTEYAMSDPTWSGERIASLTELL